MSEGRRIAVVGIIVEDRVQAAPTVNEVLGRHADVIVGRMGIPYREKDVSTIALIVDGTAEETGRLTGELGGIPGVRVKSVVTA